MKLLLTLNSLIFRIHCKLGTSQYQLHQAIFPSSATTGSTALPSKRLRLRRCHRNPKSRDCPTKKNRQVLKIQRGQTNEKWLLLIYKITSEYFPTTFEFHIPGFDCAMKQRLRLHRCHRNPTSSVWTWRMPVVQPKRTGRSWKFNEARLARNDHSSFKA